MMTEEELKRDYRFKLIEALKSGEFEAEVIGNRSILVTIPSGDKYQLSIHCHRGVLSNF